MEKVAMLYITPGHVTLLKKPTQHKTFCTCGQQYVSEEDSCSPESEHKKIRISFTSAHFMVCLSPSGLCHPALTLGSGPGEWMFKTQGGAVFPGSAFVVVPIPQQQPNLWFLRIKGGLPKGGLQCQPCSNLT